MTIEAERVVIDCCINEPEVLPRVVDELSPHDFNDTGNAETFRTIQKLFTENKPVDFVTVKTIAKTQLDHSFIGNYFHLYGNISYYIEVLQQNGIKKNLDIALKKAQTEIKKDPDNINTTIEELTTGIFNITSRTDENREDVGRTVWKQYKAQKAKRKDGVPQYEIPSGFKKLDLVTGGFQAGTLTIIGGRSSHGKSTLALDFFHNVGSCGVPSLYVSLESQSPEVYLYLLQKKTGLQPLTVKTGMLNETEEIEMVGALDMYRKYPFSFVDTANTLSDILLKIRSFVIQKKIRFVVVDYIQLIENTVKGESRHVQVAGVSRSLKRLAMQLNIAIVALSQLNKEPENRGGIIRMGDLRESEAIGHDADYIVFINRPSLFSRDKDEAVQHVDPDYIELAKNRHGQTIPKIEVTWNSKYNRYEEVNEKRV